MGRPLSNVTSLYFADSCAASPTLEDVGTGTSSHIERLEEGRPPPIVPLTPSEAWVLHLVIGEELDATGATEESRGITKVRPPALLLPAKKPGVRREISSSLRRKELHCRLRRDQDARRRSEALR